MYPPTDPAFEKFKTKAVKSKQKRWIKTPGLNENVSPTATCDPIEQNAS